MPFWAKNVENRWCDSECCWKRNQSSRQYRKILHCGNWLLFSASEQPTELQTNKRRHYQDVRLLQRNLQDQSNGSHLHPSMIIHYEFHQLTDSSPNIHSFIQNQSQFLIIWKSHHFFIDLFVPLFMTFLAVLLIGIKLLVVKLPKSGEFTQIEAPDALRLSFSILNPFVVRALN